MPLDFENVVSVDPGLPDAYNAFNFVKRVVLVALASSLQFALLKASLVDFLLPQLLLFPQFIGALPLVFKLLNHIFYVQ